MSTLVSTTVHCARCHAHKFDPISQEEYYSLQAIFAGVDKAERAYDPDPAIARRRRELKTRKAELPTLAQKSDPALLTDAIAGQVAVWERKLSAAGGAWRIIDPDSFVSANGASLAKQSDGSITSTGTRPDKDTYTITITAEAPKITGLRLEVLADDALPMKGPGRQDNGNLHLNEIEVLARPAPRPMPPTPGRSN